MKYLVATRADSKISRITKITIPLIEKYAKEMSADFKILDQEPPIWTTEVPPRAHYRIMEFYNLFNDYDRILSIDSDLLITPNCTNIFDLVPYDHIGSIYEDVGDSTEHRRTYIKLIQDQFGDVGWKEGYINTGFAVFSKIHRDIFTTINGKYYMDFGIDDVHLCYQIHKFGFKIYPLDYKWNHMTMFSHQWNNYANRFDANIIHYAGEGIFDRNNIIMNRTDQIESDYKKIYG